MNNLYEQMNFVLSGGALQSLTDFLARKVSAALIVSQKGADLEISDAVGVTPGNLFLRGWGLRLAQAFPERGKSKKFEVSCASVTDAEIAAEWPWAVAVRGKRWAFYILLRDNPEAMLDELTPEAGLVALWQEFHSIDAMEERLSRVAYMILATKNTLAAIFEPMPLNYYASFLTDVINESLFPRSISIFKGSGEVLERLSGKDDIPERTGVFGQKLMPPPAPVVTKRDTLPCEVVLPIMEPYQLYCVTKWDKLPEEEALDFLELVGNLASRALTINELRIESTDGKNKISSEKYTILALNRALDALRTRQTRQDLLSMAMDIFTEMTKVEECMLVSWNAERQAYIPFEYRKGGMKTACDLTPLPSEEVSRHTEPDFFELEGGDFPSLLKCPWHEMSNMKLAFPIWDRCRMAGFIAVTSDRTSLAEDDKLYALAVVAQFTAFSLKNFA